MANASDTDALRRSLPFDSGRAAIASIRGYDWQRWLTVKAWLGLEAEQSLWIEWGEDFTIADYNGVLTIQAKDTQGGISLGLQTVRVAIERALALRSEVVTLIWTRSTPIVEAMNRSGIPGIALWTAAADGADTSEIRALLAKLTWTERVIQETLRGSDEVLRKALKRVRWLTGEAEIGELRTSVEVATEHRMSELGVPSAARRRASAAKLLFSHVAIVGVQPQEQDRRLTRIDLDKLLLDMNAEQFSAVLPALQMQGLGPLGIDALLDDRAPSVDAPEPFSLEWYMYNERAIDLIGRADELAALQAFCGHEASFLWWALGGEAGAGKSRLAVELLRSVSPTWHGGFVEPAKIVEAVSAAMRSACPVLLIVDYAARQPGLVAEALRMAALGQAISHIRVLLLERDISPDSALMQRLVDRSSPAGRKVRETAYREPLSLPSLLCWQDRIIDSWLEAGAADIRAGSLNDQARRRISVVTGGNPLLLGFVAAVMAEENGVELTRRSLDALLEPRITKEIVRWQDGSTGRVELSELLGLAAIAGLTRGYLGPAVQDNEYAFVTHGTADDRAVLMVEEAGKYRLPTLLEAIDLDPSGTVRLDVEVRSKAARTALSAIIPEKHQPAALAALRSFAGRNLVLQPDLVLEYFLAVRWGELARTGPSLIERATDPQVVAEVQAALRLAPLETLFTLDQLRTQALGSAAFLRVAAQLRQALEPVRSELDPWVPEEISRLLYNAFARLGGREPLSYQAVQLGQALDDLASLWANNDLVAYRRAKVIRGLYAGRAGDDRLPGVGRFLAVAPPLADLAVERGEPEFGIFLLEAATLAARQAGPDGLDPMLTTLQQAFEAGVRAGAGDPDYLAMVCRASFVVSVALANVLPEEVPFQDTELAVRAALLDATLGVLTDFLQANAESLPRDAAEDLRKGLVNLTLGYSKLANAEQARAAQAAFDRLPRGRVKNSDEAEMRLNVLRNVLRASRAADPNKHVSPDEIALLRAAAAVAGPSGQAPARLLYLDMFNILARSPFGRESAEALGRDALALLLRDWDTEPPMELWLSNVFEALLPRLPLSGCHALHDKLIDVLLRPGNPRPILRIAQRATAGHLISMRIPRKRAEAWLIQLAREAKARGGDGLALGWLADAMLMARLRWGPAILQGAKAVVAVEIKEANETYSIRFPEYEARGDDPVLTVSILKDATIRSNEAYR